MPVADDDLWSAIGDPTRRRLLEALLFRGRASATALAEEMPVTRQAIVKHLVVLERVGLVRRERHGREIQFEVDPNAVDTAAEAMARVAATWDKRLLRIKQLSEAAHRRQAGLRLD